MGHRHLVVALRAIACKASRPDVGFEARHPNGLENLTQEQNKHNKTKALGRVVKPSRSPLDCLSLVYDASKSVYFSFARLFMSSFSFLASFSMRPHY